MRRAAGNRIARATTVVLVGLMVAGQAGADQATVSALRPPPLDQPATASPRAASAVFTAVTQAGKRVVAVGERGIVLLSDDEGRIWRQARAVPVSVTLTGVRFVSASRGWAIGHAGVILHTEDGGETWTRQMDGIAAASLVRDAARLLPDGPAKLAAERSADQLLSDGPDKPFLDLQAKSDQVLVVGAYGLALQSGDGGAHWRSAVAHFADPQGLHIYHLAGDGAVGIAVGEQGLFLISHDGARFEPASLKHRGTFFGVLATHGAVIAYGLQGAMFRSTDHGASWAPVSAGTEAAIACAAPLEDGRIVIGALDGTLRVSRDDGASFQSTQVDLGAPVSGIVQSGEALVVTGARGVMRVALSRLPRAS